MAPVIAPDRMLLEGSLNSHGRMVPHGRTAGHDHMADSRNLVLRAPRYMRCQSRRTRRRFSGVEEVLGRNWREGLGTQPVEEEEAPAICCGRGMLRSPAIEGWDPGKGPTFCSLQARVVCSLGIRGMNSKALGAPDGHRMAAALAEED